MQCTDCGARHWLQCTSLIRVHCTNWSAVHRLQCTAPIVAHCTECRALHIFQCTSPIAVHYTNCSAVHRLQWSKPVAVHSTDCSALQPIAVLCTDCSALQRLQCTEDLTWWDDRPRPPCRSQSHGTWKKSLNTVMNTHCNECILQWMHTLMNAYCNECSLQWMHTSMNAHFNECASASENLTVKCTSCNFISSRAKSNKVGLSPISSQPRLATLDSADLRLDLGRLVWT